MPINKSIPKYWRQLMISFMKDFKTIKNKKDKRELLKQKYFNRDNRWNRRIQNMRAYKTVQKKQCKC